MSATKTEDRYRAVFQEHHQHVYAYFRRRIDAEQAKDCTAETFLVAWRKVELIPEGDELRWLYVVARNVLRNAYRTKRRSQDRLGEPPRQIPDPSPSPEAMVVDSEAHQEVIAAMHRLRPNDQEILMLAVWEELPRTTIASVLGCSEHAASQRLHRASRRLAKELERANGAKHAGNPASLRSEGTP
ncbi:MAG: RNA polymerase sigma factor [Acidimicrobiia bacterium]